MAKKKQLSPKDFANVWPMASVAKNYELESTATNIMLFLANYHDNQWKELTFKEYLDGYEKSGTPMPEWYQNTGKREFDMVVRYTVTAETAKCFSPNWNKI